MDRVTLSRATARGQTSRAQAATRLGVGARPSAPRGLRTTLLRTRKVARRDVSQCALIDRPTTTNAEENAEQNNTVPTPPAGYSGLMGKALLTPDRYPTKREVFDAIPKDCWKKDTFKSMCYAVFSTSLTVALGVAAYCFIPLKLAFLPVWALYAAVTGTVATGAWVVAHECGHDAFSDNKTLQDTVGYVLHSALLVPYFSWQRSHAVHHSRTNHMEEGETHVPFKSDSAKGQANYALKEAIGEDAFAIVNLFVHLVVGWPAYLISGATGGPKYGVTNHFWPVKPFSDGLFPTDLLKKKVWLSNVGCMATLAALATWAVKAGSILPVMAVYAGPYVVTNFWLVLYTWLQHTDVDVPHFSGKEWDWVKGTFMTIDRPYPPVIDFLHHKIGTTHVAHHISHQIPHYNAQRATDAIKENFPHLYLYDPTPIAEAMIRVGKECVAAERFGDKFLFVSKKSDLQSN